MIFFLYFFCNLKAMLAICLQTQRSTRLHCFSFLLLIMVVSYYSNSWFAGFGSGYFQSEEYHETWINGLCFASLLKVVVVFSIVAKLYYSLIVYNKNYSQKPVRACYPILVEPDTINNSRPALADRMSIITALFLPFYLLKL